MEWRWRFKRFWPMTAVQQCSGISGQTVTTPFTTVVSVTLNKHIGDILYVYAHMETQLVYHT